MHNIGHQIKRLLSGLLLHGLILWAALALGSNSYKEVMRKTAPLTMAVRHSIIATFPWAIGIFSSIYLAFSIRKSKKSIFLNIRQYAVSTALYMLLINLLFYSKGQDILIALNLSVIYFALLLTLSGRLAGFFSVKRFDLSHSLKLQDWTPPIIYRNMPGVWEYVKERTSAPFITGFMALLLLCAFFLILNKEKFAGQLADIAYFLLVLGVMIELYRIIKYGRSDG